MDMEEQDSGIDISSLSLTIDDDDDDDGEIFTQEESEDDDYDTSTDEDDYDYQNSTEEGNAGPPSPPIHIAEDPASPPEWILLDVRGYVDARRNATTASACRSNSRRGAMRVTFWAARPPRFSCFTVHCDGNANPNDAVRGFPTVLAAADDLVLLRVTTGPPRHVHALPDRYTTEHYVYQAAGATPTLRLLTDVPCDLGKVGILRCGGDDSIFLVAAIRLVTGTSGGQFDLHLFDSRTWTWTTRPMRVDTPERYARFGFRSTKVLSIGGERGSMAWVDLWHGMLVCDLLAVHGDDDATLRYVPLPPSPGTDREGCPSFVRDIAVVDQGRIKFFEMRFKVKERAVTSTATLVTRYWKATAWEKQTNDPWQQDDWRKDYGLDIFKVPVDRAHPELPPRLHDMGMLHGYEPALSLEGGRKITP